MARPTKANLLKFYKHELDRARDWRLTEGYDDLWDRMIDLYRGQCLPTVESAEDRIVVNVAFGTINVIYPSVSVNYPKITVMPNRPEDEERAVITEAVTNYNWKHFNFQDQFRLAVKDYLVVGHGWIKTGYTYKEKEQELDAEARGTAYADAIDQADQFATENPHMAGDVPDDTEILDALPDTEIIVSEDQPWVERISPFDIYVDPEATCVEDMRWICQRIYRPLADVKSDTRYKPGARSKVEADAGTDVREEQRAYQRRNLDEPQDKRVTIWEWYDIKNDRFAVMSEGNTQEFLIDPRPSPYAFGHPFVMIRNYDVPDYFYPMGDLEAIEPLIDELNKTRSISIAVRKKFARKYLYHAGAFDSTGRQALESDVDNTFVPVANEHIPLGEVVVALPQTQVAPELFQHSDTVEKDIGDVSGVSEYQRGQVPETRRTATEASIISDSVNARSADKLAQVEVAVSRTARRIVQLQQQFMSQTQVARISGPDGAIYWIPYDKDDIKGEFDFDVEAGSTQPMNETVRRQTATAMMQALGPFIGTVVDPNAIVQHVLKFGFGVPNPQKFLMAPPPMVGPDGQPVPPGGGDPSQQPGGVGGPQGAPMGPGFEGPDGMPGNMMPGGMMGGG